MGLRNCFYFFFSISYISLFSFMSRIFPIASFVSIPFCARLSDDESSDFRLTNLGYVFQSYNLVPELTAIENVYISLLMTGQNLDSAKKRASEVLIRVGLGDRINYYPSELSGGSNSVYLSQEHL
jgi:ABC-type arginine transport system ATPase subunit